MQRKTKLKMQYNISDFSPGSFDLIGGNLPGLGLDITATPL